MNSVDAAGVLYESDRKFQVWTWAVGHSMLHLRSNPSANDSTRIEIVFTPVILVCLGFRCVGLATAAAPHAPLPQVLQATLGRTLREYETVYSIRSRATQA